MKYNIPGISQFARDRFERGMDIVFFSRDRGIVPSPGKIPRAALENTKIRLNLHRFRRSEIIQSFFSDELVRVTFEVGVNLSSETSPNPPPENPTCSVASSLHIRDAKV